MRRTIVSSFVTTLISPIPAFGTELDVLSELDYLADLPVTFSATRLPQTLNKAPASITLIDRRMIEASSATTISELFRLVPGMQSYHIATNASAVSYHGMSDKFPSRMEVMIDGRSVYTPLFSAVIWESLPISIDDIERIEVVRGSNTVTQGNNAFLGAINIITLSGLNPRENMVKYQQGEFDNKTVYSRFSATHDLGYYSVSAGITGNEGNRFNSGNYDPYFNRYLNFNTSISPTLLDTFTINLGVNAGYSSVGDIANLPNPRRREFESFFQNLEWKRLLDNQNELIVRYSHSMSDYDAATMPVDEMRSELSDEIADIIDSQLQSIGYTTDRDALAQAFLSANPFKITAEIGKIETHQIELNYKWVPSPYDQLLSGIEFRHAAAKNFQLFDTNNWVTEQSSRLFSNWENTQLTNWTFNLGASLEHGGNNSTRISPRIAANYQLNDSVMLRSAANRAYRMPSLIEPNYNTKIHIPSFDLPIGNLIDLYGPILDHLFEPNPNLKPERLDSVDLGLLVTWPKYNSNLDVRLFYEEIDDAITETRQAGDNGKTISYSNLSEWQNKGFEVQYKYQRNSGYKPLVVVNYGYIQSSGYRILDNRDNGYWYDDLDTRNPEHTASLLASITLPNDLQVSVSHYFLSSVAWIEAARKNSDPHNKPYHRTDLKIAKTFKVSPQNKLKIALIVQNLLDNPYSEFYPENMFEQRTYLQAQLSF
ncbi:TonB-dependent receptor [Amphritea sp. 1_MG-2023]|uniref:TonB-dependent receptor plug domain-containing protein n=1 Tax=Amphritea sp. 1_MG-2023 TaxID=3062670 RepID=UPI0026E38722|nr:TonB-dependent receptor [Amphritea sp. 1_MG-2023]MDO6565217.1 TonB-dependent receptor [Amphritea sp. 1_MG-2023]